MVSLETLREQFDELGCDPSEAIIEKCIEICHQNNVDDPVEFVEKWMTFSISKFNGAEPTVEYLEAFERSELQNQPKLLRQKISRQPENFEGKRQKFQDSDEEENDILGAYITVTPKPQKKSVSRLNQTPEVARSASKIVTSEKSGNVVYSFGNFGTALEGFSNSSSVNVKLAELNDETQWLDSREKYLTASMQNDGPLITNKIFELGKDFAMKIQVNDEQIPLSHCDEISQNPIRCLGKIIISEGKKQNSITFVQFDETKSRHVQLDLSRMKQAQIFSGQVCIIQGTNPRGNLFYPTEIFAERELEVPELPQLSSSLQIMIASGPFSDKEDFLCEYLDQLLVVCKNNKPDLLILTGAFIDRKSSKVGDLLDDVEDYFNSILTKVSESVGNDTKIVIVSSSNDVNSSICYPTRPYKFAKLRNFPNIFFAPDPSIIDVNGLKIGVTSVDVQTHFEDNEFCINSSADKIRRFVNNIFNQKSFYPIFPYNMPTSIEHLHEHANINKIPNILILPSELKFYIRDINGCLCVNPGHSSNDGKLGTFARIIIQPPKDEKHRFMSGQIVNL